VSRSHFSRLIVTAALFGASGCISITTPRFMMPAPERDWKPTLSEARSLASTGKSERADSLLARFAASYPDSPQAIETNYWRSLFLLNGSNGLQNADATIPMLHTYLASGATEHHIEADALLRAAARVDTLSRATAALTTRVVVSNGDIVTGNTRAADAKPDAKPVTADAKDQDAEIKRLRDELAKSKEELDRIKKRLAEPTKKPPG
jgi:hypothetical protein